MYINDMNHTFSTTSSKNILAVHIQQKCRIRMQLSHITKIANQQPATAPAKTAAKLLPAARKTLNRRQQ
jgi:hypothetical protein